MQTATKIKVVGVGGCGANTVNSMIDFGVSDVDFYVVNTDLQHLNMSKVEEDKRIQIGIELTRGQGAGARPEIGEKAAEESRKALTDMLENTDLLFIVAGMGGGTGTGASPVIAKYARELNPDMLIIAIVTKPFNFERNKMALADMGMGKLQKYVDSLIVIPNQRLLEYDKDIFMLDAYSKANEILRNSIKSISDLINYPSLVNLDFADVKTIMKGKGYSHMGIGECEGDNTSDRMLKAVKMAANANILNTSIAGATGLIFSIQTGADVTIREIEEANEFIAGLVAKDVNYIFGHSFDKNIKNKVVVTIIATGCKSDGPQPQQHLGNAGARNNFSGMVGKPQVARPQRMPEGGDYRPASPSPIAQRPVPSAPPQPNQPTRIESMPRQDVPSEAPSFMKRLLGRNKNNR